MDRQRIRQGVGLAGVMCFSMAVIGLWLRADSNTQIATAGQLVAVLIIVYSALAALYVLEAWR